MAIALPGLASGLDSATLINSLMQLEAIPQTLLKNRVSATNTRITDLQILNSRVQSLATVASGTAKPEALQLFKATSSATSATATADATAAPGTIDIVVGSTAHAQTSVTAAYTAWPDNPPTLTFVAADGTQTEITAPSADLDEVARAITNSEAGVTATKVASGTDVNGDPQYRLQLVGNKTGVEAAFTVFRGGAASVTAGTAINLLAAPGAATVTAATDAAVTLWAGSPAAQTITSATNTFADLLPGVDVTVQEITTEPTTVTVARDSAAAGAKAKSLVDSLIGVFSMITSGSATSKSQDAAGNEITKLGSFTGDSTVRTARQQLVTATSAPVDGISPSEIGISFDKAGVLSFDAAKFQEALADDPARVESIVAEIATRVTAAAEMLSDKHDGLLTSKINGQESVVDDMKDRIDTWDRQLGKRRATLQRTYAALEVQLSALNSQSSWLSSQLAALPKSSRD
ncbi:MAG: flagellar filament capping protein FliD [Microbacteriaceae bacterium]